MKEETASKEKVEETLLALGDKWASNWLWSCTPYPAGLPSVVQCDEAISAALSKNPDVQIGAILTRCDDEMWEAHNSGS